MGLTYLMTTLPIMKKISALALLISLCTLPVANSVAAWQDLGGPELFTVYADPDTMSVNGDKVQIMSMLDFKKPGVNPKTKAAVNSIVGLNEYDCANAKYRPIEFKEFAGNKGSGKVVSDNKTPDSAFEDIANGSWAAGVFNIACKRK